MCGRFMMTSPVDAVNKLFGVESGMNIAARYNIAPQQKVPIIREEAVGRVCVEVEWGLTPAWAKERRTSKPLINARSETIKEKPSFRSAYKMRRCLVPANGYYEWKSTPEGKQPYLIQLPEQALFAMAGIWERWETPVGEEVVESMAILTQEANPKLSHIHHRMPVLVPPHEFDTWLLSDVGDKQDPLALIDTSFSEQLMYRPVSKRLNSVANEGCELILEENSSVSSVAPAQGKLL